MVVTQIGRLQNLFYWEQAITKQDESLDQVLPACWRLFRLLQHSEINQLDDQTSATYKFKQWANLSITVNKLQTAHYSIYRI